MIKFIKVSRSPGQKYAFTEIWVNPKDIVIVEEDIGLKSALLENSSLFPTDLSTSVIFSTISTTTTSYNIVGSPSEINEKLAVALANKRSVLLG